MRARCGRGYDGFDPALGEQAPQVVGVVGFIGEQLADRAGSLDELCSDRDVVGIAGRQDEDARTPLFVGKRVELARAAAARRPERLLEGPPFPPAAERCALMCVLSIIAAP